MATLQILDDDGNILKQIPMHQRGSFGGVEVLKQDKDNFIYIRAERIDIENHIHLEVRKIDEEGNIVSTIEMPNRYYTTTYKKIEIDEVGNIYQLLTTPEGVQVIKWEQQ